jgi:hypothetical protein
MGYAVNVIMAVVAAVGLAACDQSGAQAAAAAAKPAPPAPASEVRVPELPLKRGYYVASDTPCAKASNATLMLLRRDGVGGARDFCAFQSIVRIAPNAYRVTQACGDLQDPSPPQASTATYTLSDDTGFTAAHEDGWSYSARHCAQASLPPDWRDNDISDVTR